MKKLDHSDDHPDQTEVARLAVELYARDQERAAEEEAAKSALTEMAVPDEFMEKARRALELKKAQELLASRRRRTTRLILAPIILIALSFALYGVYEAFLPPPKPYTIGFDVKPWTQWAVDLNSASVAHGDTFKATASQPAYARLVIDKFAYTKREFWVSFVAHRGPFQMARHHEITFRARSSGLPCIRLRFIKGADEWRSEVLSLTKEWQDYSVNLDNLEQDQRAGRFYNNLGPGHRIADSVDVIKVDLGEFVNPVQSKGYVDLQGLTVR